MDKNKASEHPIALASAWFHFSGAFRAWLCEQAGLMTWYATLEFHEIPAVTRDKIHQTFMRTMANRPSRSDRFWERAAKQIEEMTR